MKDIDKLFWDANINEIKKGYVYDEETSEYICLICGKIYEDGVIYPQGDTLYMAVKAMEKHIAGEHGPMFNYLIDLNKRYTGLTDIQKEVLMYFYQGISDKDIVRKQAGGSTSTIRNHRFKLKEKQKQAKVFLAVMELLNEENGNMGKKHAKDGKENKEEFVTIHKGVTMVDERFAITKAEKDKILGRYLKDGRITNLPSKEKRRIIILQHIIESFQPNKRYTEKEVNEIIKKIYVDYVTIRRYFIEYGFMDRENDCSAYWLKV